MTRFHLKALAAAVLAFGAVSVQADTVGIPSYAFGGNLAVTVDVAGVAVSGEPAGAFNTSVNGGASFLSYCIDLTQSAPLGGSDSTYSRVAGGSYSFAKPTAAADLSKLFTFAGSLVNSISTAAAFQLAVWEIVYESSANAYSMNAGSAKFGVQDPRDVGTLTLADSWLTALRTTSATAPISVLTSVRGQDLVYGGATATAPIPEPSTYALMLAGLAGVGFVARRRASKKA